VTAVIERLYRLLLALLPRDFRDRFGAELLDTARALDADARTPRLAVRAVSDALLTPLRSAPSSAPTRVSRRHQGRCPWTPLFATSASRCARFAGNRPSPRSSR
jgi:hypothetical protein